MSTQTPLLHQIEKQGFKSTWKTHCKEPAIFIVLSAAFVVAFPGVILSILGWVLATIATKTDAMHYYFPFGYILIICIAAVIIFPRVKAYLFPIYGASWLLKEKQDLKQILKKELSECKNSDFEQLKKCANLASNPEIFRKERTIIAVKIVLYIIGVALSAAMLIGTIPFLYELYSISGILVRYWWLIILWLPVNSLPILIALSINMKLELTANSSVQRRI